MGRSAAKKEERHIRLIEKLKENPFLRDEELARVCNVSVATIRIDRAELGIKQYRERVKSAAAVKTNTAEVLDLNILHDGLAVLNTDENMVFEGTNIIKGQSLYAFAESLALSVLNTSVAIVKVANVKYVQEAHEGERLFARSKVIRIRDDSYIVHVFIKANLKEVFRGKFNLMIPGN